MLPPGETTRIRSMAGHLPVRLHTPHAELRVSVVVTGA